jgi:hypothetical protein
MDSNLRWALCWAQSKLLRTFFETFALLKGYLGTKKTEKSLQDTLVSVFEAFFLFLESRIEIVKLVQLHGSLRHEYIYTRVI